MSIKLLGHLGSPYSRKFRAFLRYKQIPFQFIRANTEEADLLPKAKIPIMPAVYYPEEGYSTGHTDSTPLMITLNKKYPSRTTIPNDPAVSFINDILEDFADEWVVKAMFHYRWKYDVEHNSQYLMLATNPSINESVMTMMANKFAERQIARLDKVVGVNETTASFVEESYLKTIKICNAIFTEHKFLLGNRPSSADFGFFGQYAQLVSLDPTPCDLARKDAPRVKPWCDVMDDLSGTDATEDGWMSRTDIENSRPHKELFKDINDIYLPFLHANSEALNEGKKEFEVELCGSLWKQNTFPYQAKCLRHIHSTWDQLSSEDKDFIRSLSLKSL